MKKIIRPIFYGIVIPSLLFKISCAGSQSQSTQNAVVLVNRSQNFENHNEPMRSISPDEAKPYVRPINWSEHKLTDDHIQMVIKSSNEDLNTSAIRALQSALGLPMTGKYDKETVIAVASTQREKGIVVSDRNRGKAGPVFLPLVGQVYFNKFKPVIIDDKEWITIKNDEYFKRGFNVALYTSWKILSTWKNPHAIDESETIKTTKERKKLKELYIEANEFFNKSIFYTKKYRGLYVINGHLRIGDAVRPLEKHRANPVYKPGDFVEIIQNIHLSLLARYERDSAEKAKYHNEIPPYIKIRNLAYFTHGMPWGVAMNSNNKNIYYDGMHSVEKQRRPPNVRAFLSEISNSLSPEVNILLYACSTASQTNAVQVARDGQLVDTDRGYRPLSIAKDNDLRPLRLPDIRGRRLGQESLAHTIYKTLLDLKKFGSTVFAHTSPGHTSNNLNAMGFGKGVLSDNTDENSAELPTALQSIKKLQNMEVYGNVAKQLIRDLQKEGGTHLFEILYSDEFLETQLKELKPQYPELSKPQKSALRENMEGLAYLHMLESTFKEETNNDGSGEPENMRFKDHDVGMEAFMDLDTTRRFLEEDFKTWLKQHLRDLDDPAFLGKHGMEGT